MHDELDRQMMPMALYGNLQDFLMVQYRARLPLERWLASNCASPPPAQTPLLAAALEASGVQPSEAANVAWNGHRLEAVGLAWLLAGSSLGNRAILAQRKKAGLRGGESFLADEAMIAYWTELKTDLERHHDDLAAHHALTGARRGFAHFLATIECERRLEATA